MRVNIDTEEIYPVYTLTYLPKEVCPSESIEVPDEVVRRWLDANAAWQRAQDEMKQRMLEDLRQEKQR